MTDVLTPFKDIQILAEQRKGGKARLAALLARHEVAQDLALVTDDRILAMMCRCIFNAGFNWKVIANKWPGFEEAFHGFNPRGLAFMSPETREAYVVDQRIVRNQTKIRAVFANAEFVMQVAEQHGSFGKFLQNWPTDDQVGLMDYLKKQGSRLGGNTGMYFLRFIGKDCFILSRDVVGRLKASGLEISERPSSKRDLKAVQAAFNQWQQQSELSYADISRILAYSIGRNQQLEKRG